MITALKLQEKPFDLEQSSFSGHNVGEKHDLQLF